MTRYSLLHRLLPSVWLLALTATTGLAADKNGVAPGAISLPKGPGSIEGLGESFQPNLNTGTAKYRIGFKVPTGVAGVTPALSLVYEAGGANGPEGYGWRLPLPYIQRRSDHGIPTYGRNVGFARSDSFINEMREELVPQTNGFYFSQNEGSFIRYQQVEDHWVGTRPDGTRLEFGLSREARVQEADRIFCWMLERETDTHGNTILYSYRNFAGDKDLNQVYLAGIHYGPGAPPWTSYHFVQFEYEDRPDWFEDCRSGFAVRTGHRLKSVVIGTQGVPLPGHVQGDFDGDGQPDFLDRRYDLEYLRYAGADSHWSLVASVVPVGADGVSTLPAISFTYAVSDPPAELSAAGRILGGSHEPPVVMDNNLVEFVDLNGDGLPDILKTDFAGGSHQAYLNLGEIPLEAGRAIDWDGPHDVDPGPGGAWNFGLDSAATHLADMDGDGLADLVHKSAENDVFYFRNLGRRAWGPRQPVSTSEVPPPAPFGEDNVRIADLDFDKRMDIVQSISSGGGVVYRIWFNMGQQTYSAPFAVSPAVGFLFSDNATQVADCNGDRVPDIARIRPTEVVVLAGLGYGDFGGPMEMALPDTTLDDDQVGRARLIDLNGDGLADLVLERAAPGECWYWLNLGNYQFSLRKVITGLPTGLSVHAATRWADINGNGTIDLIYADHEANPRLQAVDLGELLDRATTANILTGLSNGIGRVTLIGYDSSTTFALADAAAGRPWSSLMPMALPVVAAVTNLDSLGHQYVNHFRYHDGYYDPVEKQFRGFGRVEQIEVGDASAPTLVTQSIFDTGQEFESMKGRLLRVTSLQEDGKVFSDVTTTWTVPPVLLMSGTNGLAVTFAHPLSQRSEILERDQGPPRILESEFDYDSYGNQVRMANYGIVEGDDRSAFDDERIVTTEYAANTDRWILRRPIREETKNENGTVLSRTESYYDDESFSGTNPGSVTLGDLTLVRSWVDASNPTAYIQDIRRKYDRYGNVVMSLDPLASVSEGVPDVTQGHLREVEFDPHFHSYPVAEIIDVGGGHEPLEFHAAYDEGFGTLTASVDFNGNETTYGYDAFSRLINTVRPGDTPDRPTTEYEYALAVPVDGGGLVNFIETRRLDKAADLSGSSRDHDQVSRDFSDGLGRHLMTKEEAEPGPGAHVPRVVVRGAVLFNAREKPEHVLNPYFSLQPGTNLDEQLAFEDVEAPGWQGSFHQDGELVSLDLPHAQQTSISYDAILRPVETTNADGSQRRTVYEPLVVKSYDEEDADPSSPFHDTPVAQYRDGLSRLIRIDETSRLSEDGTPGDTLNTWTTLFGYDLNDCLTRITDSQGNLKTLEYDGLRRKTVQHDPDCGTTASRYDDASNLIETVDARGQRISYTYDGANRILTEDYHDEGLPFSGNFPFNPRLALTRTNRPDVAYFYDAPGPDLALPDGSIVTAANSRGNLAGVWDLSGEQYTSYDNRNRIAWTLKRIPDLGGNPANLLSYQTGFEYDSLDRLTRLTYPDGDQVAYEYNDRSLISRIVGGPTGSIVSNLVYCPSSQTQQLDYGNGVRSGYAYDSRLRLARLKTLGPAATNGPRARLVDFTYGFDRASNITSVEDGRDLFDPVMSGRSNSQSFDYDDLYRLTRVEYGNRDTMPGDADQVSYRYDRIGNMLEQTSTITALEDGRPVADLGELEFGGDLGRFQRGGREPGNPPGPHALTSIVHGSDGPIREYPYDANGNIANLDGVVFTWDFKDRLASAEDGRFRATYTYDYTDRRIAKTVSLKAQGPDSGSPAPDSGALSAGTTLYVNRSFEVRDHDQPVKYVFSGATRIASTTGSLSSRARLQRLRLYSGWNLVSLAVIATNGIGQLTRSVLHSTGGANEGIEAVYRWDSASRSYVRVEFGETLAAGSVLWIEATTNLAAAVVGGYMDPVRRTVNPGGDYLAATGLEVWSIDLPPDFSASMYDAGTRRWREWFGGELALAPDSPPILAPGQAVFVNSETAADLEIPDPDLRIQYFHLDHLGSSSVVTDAAGVLVEETAFYPFGAPRQEIQPRQSHQPYQFAQKERDQETGLHYFEERFLASRLARFSRADPKYLNPDLLTQEELGTFLSNPQRLNLYAYALNNPLNFADPTGLSPWSWFRENVWIPGVDPVSEFDGGRTAGNALAVAGAVAGSLSCPETGFGCGLAVVSADYLQADLRGTRPLGAQGITKVTGSKRAGDIGYAVVAAGLSAGLASAKIANAIARSRAVLGATSSTAAAVAEQGPKTWPKVVYEPPPPETPTLPGWNAPETFNYDAVRLLERTERSAAAWNSAVNATPRTAWIQATLDATRDTRFTLPTLEDQAKACSAIYEMGDVLFPQ